MTTTTRTDQRPDVHEMVVVHRAFRREAGAAAGYLRTTPEGDTRRVCRLERATGSNMQQRVCRDIPRAGVQDQQTREFMRSMQRMRMPDEGAQVTPGGPNG